MPDATTQGATAHGARRSAGTEATACAHGHGACQLRTTPAHAEHPKRSGGLYAAGRWEKENQLGNITKLV